MLKLRWRIATLIGLSAVTLLAGASDPHRAASLVYLDLSGRVIRVNADGTDPTELVAAAGQGPDGIAVDRRAGHIYWTNMGKVNLDDGTIMRSDLNGKNLTTIVPAGGTFTPKQLKIDTRHHKLYWSDREGMRVMRANLDGSKIETLIVTGSGDVDRKDQSKWCVGIALDVERGKIYWTQKGGDNAGKGTIKRANLEIPAGENAAHRSDIEVLFANLPEPIDLDLDVAKRQMYWTDRGDNTVSRAPMDLKPGFDPTKRSDREILAKGMNEAIGIALDLANQRLFYTSLRGEVGTVKLNGKDAQTLLTHPKGLTGIALLE